MPNKSRTVISWGKLLMLRQQRSNFDVSDVPMEVLDRLKRCRIITGSGIMKKAGVITKEAVDLFSNTQFYRVKKDVGRK